MLCIYNPSTDPYFNLATEEYMFTTFTENIFMIWQNEPSVIIGKHQDVWSEINMGLVNELQIKVARRFSGGGAVYHDPGNLNLTFIESNASVDFNLFTGQIVDFLHTLGIIAIPDSRQGLTVNGLKISGSAQYIRKGRIMHHATLLFSSNLETLVKVLDAPTGQVGMEKQRRFSVPSVKSPVANLSALLPSYLSIKLFKQKLMDYFSGNGLENPIYSLTEDDQEAIKRLRDEKYAKTDWNINP